MKPQSTPHPLLTLDALFAPRRPPAERREPSLETRLPEDAGQASVQHGAPLPTRSDLERVLDAGARRQYPPRGESEVL